MDIVERFLNYTCINSTAVPGTGHLPSSPGQTTLAKLLASELRDLGLFVEEQEHSMRRCNTALQFARRDPQGSDDRVGRSPGYQY